MASLYRGAEPPTDRPALLSDMILDATPKRRRQIQAQQEHEQEAGARPSRLLARLGTKRGTIHLNSRLDPMDLFPVFGGAAERWGFPFP